MDKDNKSYINNENNSNNTIYNNYSQNELSKLYFKINKIINKKETNIKLGEAINN